MRKLFVAVNHAPGSLPAVEVAARIGAAYEHPVDLVYVYEPLHAGEAEERLREARMTLGDRGVAASIIRLEGAVAQQLARLATPDDLLVLAGRTQPSAAIDTAISPTTEDVLKAGSSPVLVVTDRTTELSRPLLAYNGSRQSRGAIRSALATLAPEVIKSATAIVVTSDEQMAERMFLEVEDMCADHGVELAQRHWSPGSPGALILEQLGAMRADMLVMGAYGRSWLREKIFGSTTEQVLRMCPVPVWMSH